MLRGVSSPVSLPLDRRAARRCAGDPGGGDVPRLSRSLVGLPHSQAEDVAGWSPAQVPSRTRAGVFLSLK